MKPLSTSKESKTSQVILPDYMDALVYRYMKETNVRNKSEGLRNLVSIGLNNYFYSAECEAEKSRDN